MIYQCHKKRKQKQNEHREKQKYIHVEQKLICVKESLNNASEDISQNEFLSSISGD